MSTHGLNCATTERQYAGLVAEITTLAEQGEQDGRGNSRDLAARLRALLTADHTAALDKVRADERAEVLDWLLGSDVPDDTTVKQLRILVRAAADIARNPGAPT